MFPYWGIDCDEIIWFLFISIWMNHNYVLFEIFTISPLYVWVLLPPLSLLQNFQWIIEKKITQFVFILSQRVPANIETKIKKRRRYNEKKKTNKNRWSAMEFEFYMQTKELSILFIRSPFFDNFSFDDRIIQKIFPNLLFE